MQRQYNEITARGSPRERDAGSIWDAPRPLARARARPSASADKKLARGQSLAGETDFFLKVSNATLTFTRDAAGLVTGPVLRDIGKDRIGRVVTACLITLRFDVFW